jgi:pimeloyl-ACP methyl ester carboxylesterase
MGMSQPAPKSSHADVNGIRLHYETHGEGGTPLIVLHGGFRMAALLRTLAGRFAADRRVIVVDLQGHGGTADVDRPMRIETMADDVAGLIRHLGLERADLIGYSLGGAVALRTAIQHPALVRKLVLVSTAFAQHGWYPEIVAQFAGIGRAIVEHMKPSPEYRAYHEVNPKPDFEGLLDKMGELLRRPYDWSAEIPGIAAPTLLVFPDHDGLAPSHMVRFFELLGGGRKDPGFDGSGMSRARLAILPGLTHYDVFDAPILPDVVRPFLDTP